MTGMMNVDIIYVHAMLSFAHHEAFFHHKPLFFTHYRFVSVYIFLHTVIISAACTMQAALVLYIHHA